MRFQKILLQCGDFDFLADIDCFFFTQKKGYFSVFTYSENDQKCKLQHAYVNTYMYCINILLQRLSKTNTMIHSKLQKYRMNVTAFTMLCNFVEKSYLQWLLPPLS